MKLHRKKSPIKERNIEIEAESLAEAIRLILKRIQGVDKNFEIKAMQEAEKGLFGMKGTKPAKIKVALKTP